MTKISNQYSLTNVLFADAVNGRVGIGTASPTVPLDVVGAGIFSGSVTATSISSVFKEGYIVKATTTGGGGSQPAYTYYTAAGSKRWASFLNVGDDKYHISNASNTELFTIQQNGNVGIGTSSPAVRLDVTGTDDVDSSIFFRVYSNNRTVWTGLGYRRIETNSELYIVANDSTIFRNSGSERMRITSAYPTILLGTSTNTWGEANRASIELNGTTTSLVGFLSGGTQKGYIYNNGTDIIGQLNSGGAWQFKSSGGGVQLTFNSTAWASISDERLKNINSYINDAVSKLNTLRTINYSWKSDATQQEFLGLIAQDVDKVFPEVIERNKKPENIGEVKDETIYLSVKYTELIPVLIKAIQELSAQVSEQQLQINELKALLNA